MSNQKNGNDQLNTNREGVNERVKKLKGLGNTKGVKWREKRRHRSI